MPNHRPVRRSDLITEQQTGNDTTVGRAAVGAQLSQHPKSQAKQLESMHGYRGVGRSFPTTIAPSERV